MGAFTAEGFKFTIKGVKLRQQKIKLPSLILVGSLVFIISTVLFTDPTANVGWAVLFFIMLFILINSFALSTARLQLGTVSPKVRRRILLGTCLVVVALMLRSAGALSLVDFVVLTLIFSGSTFYFSRRH